MTTSTVALPGVSKLTSGVNIFHPLSLTAFSISGSFVINNTITYVHLSIPVPELWDKRKQSFHMLLHDQLAH